MQRKWNLLIAGLMLFMVLAMGTAGYMFLDGWSFLDSFYMTIITLTTVGFAEVHPLTPAARILTIAVIVLGIGVGAYLLGTVSQMIIEGRLLYVLGRKKLERKILSLKNHYIICGYGRVGRIVCEEIKKSRPVPLVVIEKDNTMTPKIQEDGHLYILGDATDEESLVRAGIMQAKALVTALDSEADNVYITLTAKGLKPDLFVLARAGRIGSEKKLLRAGANKVVSPHHIGGSRMAQALLRPAVTDFIELAIHDPEIELQMEEILVKPTSSLADVPLVDSGIRQQLDLIIVAIKKASGEMLFNPASHTRIQIGDTLIALGKKKSLLKLGELLGNSSS
ncbi:MAG: NAD-binding protein [Deltaproteobacteria bacterium]|nr:NAD-binding protein [Deltaproteobacteria bacterium]MBW2071072.1 NAD-binding protein [Deltaproteobacteria bacterium]